MMPYSAETWTSMRRWIIEELVPALRENPFTGTKYATYGTSSVKVASYLGHEYARNEGDIDQIAFGIFIVNVGGNRYHVVF